MSTTIQRVQYFYTTTADKPGEGFRVLSLLADVGVNLLAFTAIPSGPMRTQLTLFPEDAGKMKAEGEKAGLKLEGPHAALMVQGDDELGALADVHKKLYDANINVYASNGVADCDGSYSYIKYVQQSEMDKAEAVLQG
jgi:hypothetical protein